jgi:O-antigen ligase
MRNITTYKPYEVNHVAALLDHPNTLGNFRALSIPFFLFFESYIFIIGMSVCCLCLFFTHSSMSIVAFGVSMWSYLLVRKVLVGRSKLWIAILGVTFALMTFVAMAVPSFNKIGSGLTGRTAAWKFAIEHIKDNPVFGQGVGRFATLNFKPDMKWDFVHNDYIEMVINFGFIGLCIFAFIVINTFKNFNLSKENTIGFSYISSMIAFLVVMCGSFPMEFAPCALIGMIAFSGSEKL